MLILNVCISFKNTIHGGSILFLFFYSKKLGYTQQEVFILTKRVPLLLFISLLEKFEYPSANIS